MTVTVTLGLARSTSTPFPVAFGEVGPAQSRSRALPIVVRTNPSESWRMVVRKRDATLIGTMKSSDTVANAPLPKFDGQDPLADVGTGDIVLPITATQNAWMVQDYFVHLYARGARYATLIVGVPDLVLVGSTQADELATYKCRTVMGLLDEAVVAPPRGWDSLPPGHDRIFDSSDPAYDDSSWDTPAEYETVQDAQSDWPVTPFGLDIPDPANVQVIGEAGYSTTDVQQPGWRYFRTTASFPALGRYKAFFVADDQFEFRIDGQSWLPLSGGWGNAHTEVWTISEGTHTLWARVLNSTVTTANPSGLAGAIWSIDDADQLDTLVVSTDASWKIWADVTSTPGFGVDEIVQLCITEAQTGLTSALTTGVARGACLDVTVANPSGYVFPKTNSISTKSQTPLSSFFLRELGETYADFEMVADEVNGGAVLNVWPKDGRGVTVPVTLAKGSNLGYLAEEGAPTSMTSAAIETHAGFHYRSITPESGHPVKEAPISLGATQTDDEADTVADSQLSQFGRKRGKVTAKHLTGPSTSDASYPKLAYWTGDTITIPADINLTAAAVRVIAMTWELDSKTGHLVFTPELGDLIVPAESRASLAVRKMTQALVGGSRAVQPQND